MKITFNRTAQIDDGAVIAFLAKYGQKESDTQARLQERLIDYILAHGMKGLEALREEYEAG